MPSLELALRAVAPDAGPYVARYASLIWSEALDYPDTEGRPRALSVPERCGPPVVVDGPRRGEYFHPIEVAPDLLAPWWQFVQ